jgi:hypothetical protein
MWLKRGWTLRQLWANTQAMTSKHEKQHWPAWSNWALLAVVLTSVVTVVAALNDIF